MAYPQGAHRPRPAARLGSPRGRGVKPGPAPPRRSGPAPAPPRPARAGPVPGPPPGPPRRGYTLLLYIILRTPQRARRAPLRVRRARLSQNGNGPPATPLTSPGASKLRASIQTPHSSLCLHVSLFRARILSIQTSQLPLPPSTFTHVACYTTRLSVCNNWNSSSRFPCTTSVSPDLTAPFASFSVHRPL